MALGFCKRCGGGICDEQIEWWETVHCCINVMVYIIKIHVWRPHVARYSYISLIKSNNVIFQKMAILSWLCHRIVQNVSFLMTSTSYISTSKIARTVALNNPIAPYVFIRNEETKSSLVKNWDFWDATLFDLLSDVVPHIATTCGSKNYLVFLYPLQNATTCNWTKCPVC